MANLVATTVPRANSIRNFLTFVNTIAITVPYVRGKNRPEPQNFGERNSSGVHKRQRIKSNTLRDATLSCHALFFITIMEIIGADPVYPEVTAFGNPLCRNPYAVVAVPIPLFHRRTFCGGLDGLVLS